VSDETVEAPSAQNTADASNSKVPDKATFNPFRPFKSLRGMSPLQVKSYYVRFTILFTLFNLEQIILWSIDSAARSSGGTIEIIGLIQAMIVTIGVSWFAVKRELRLFPLWAIILQVANATTLIVLDFSEFYWSYSAHAHSCMNVALTKPDSVYFTFTTLTTVGYGDIAPVTGTCRSIVSLQLIVGLIWLALVLALLVTRIANRSSVSTEQLAQVIEGNSTLIEANSKLLQSNVEVLKKYIELMEQQTKQPVSQSDKQEGDDPGSS
jgi:hypothetical protein